MKWNSIARFRRLALAFLLLPPTSSLADVSGTVVDEMSNPIAGAVVHFQAEPDGPSVTTGADGTFTLPTAAAGTVFVSAARTYDPDAAVNYSTEAVAVTNPSVGVVIELVEIPTMDNPTYDPPEALLCRTCHSEIFDEWATSVHSTAAEDFWVRDLFSGDGSPGGSAGFVFIDTHDPGETGTCATCHTPMADVFDPGNVLLNEALDTGDQATLDGVSCLTCHQIHRLGTPDGIHTLGGTEYRFPDSTTPTWRFVWGPLDDVSTSFMRASQAPFFKDSQLCASCHEYQAPFGQTTYQEWLDSPFAQPGPGFRSCQDCHMPARVGDGLFCDLGASAVRPGDQRHQHDFIGSTPQTLADNIDLTLEVVEQSGGLITVRASVSNFGAGHDFPTGVSIRNALLVLSAEVAGSPLNQASGPTVPEWADDDVPGQQEGDYAGMPGTGFAKILEGRINGEGDPVWPVLFVDAEVVREKSTIPSGGTHVTEVVFNAPPAVLLGSPLRVEARLLYRRAFRALAVTKGWTVTPQGGDIEIEVANEAVDTILGTASADIPTLDSKGLLALILLLLLVGLVQLQRNRGVSRTQP